DQRGRDQQNGRQWSNNDQRGRDQQNGRQWSNNDQRGRDQQWGRQRDEQFQRARLERYRQQQQQQQRLDWQRRQLLERERRIAQLRYQQRYWDRLRQDQYRLQNWQYVYAAPQYRYYRNGSYFEANQYAADLLRQAVRNGYEEGVRAGQSDREDHWRDGGYEDSFAYEDASAGYDGYYVDLSEYQYY